MECDDDQGIGDKFNSPDAIMKEARSVYNQLKMLHFTLKGNQDGDSGKFARARARAKLKSAQVLRNFLSTHIEPLFGCFV